MPIAQAALASGYPYIVVVLPESLCDSPALSTLLVGGGTARERNSKLVLCVPGERAFREYVAAFRLLGIDAAGFPLVRSLDEFRSAWERKRL